MGKVKKKMAQRRLQNVATKQRENAFEKISSRKKFDILGKKRTGVVKRTTQLRSAAVEKVRLWASGAKVKFCIVIAAIYGTFFSCACSVKIPFW